MKFIFFLLLGITFIDFLFDLYTVYVANKTMKKMFNPFAGTTNLSVDHFIPSFLIWGNYQSYWRIFNTIKPSLFVQFFYTASTLTITITDRDTDKVYRVWIINRWVFWFLKYLSKK